MPGKAPTVSAFLKRLTPERRREVTRLRALIQQHLPAGYEEVVSKNMLVYQVPLSRFSGTYNKQPLGKACIHFRSADDLPLDVVGETIASMPIDRWIAVARWARGRSPDTA